MTKMCEAELLFDSIERLLKKYIHEENIDKDEIKELANLLERYMEIECPKGMQCVASACSFGRAVEWVTFHGYTNLGELIDKLIHSIKSGSAFGDKKSIDAIDAWWAKRPGHYNP